MEKRNLGNIEVSEIGMGCMGFSHGYGEVPSKEYAIEAIRSAYADLGCTFFDTAESYGEEVFFPGHNEQLVGEAVEPFRHDIVLATKAHLHDGEFGEGADLYGSLRGHLERSLENLKTDHLDLYYLHRTNDLLAIEEVAEAMGRLISDGLIRGWGLSQVGADTIAKAHAVTPLSAVQNLYNMLERDCEEEVFPFCLEHGIGVVPFSPIASGFLSGKVTTETKFEGDDVRKFVPQLSHENIVRNQPILDLITNLAREKNATNAQIALAWMLHKYPNVVPIEGSKNKARIKENLEAANVKLTPAEFSSLDEALDSLEVHGHRGVIESEQATFGNNWKDQSER